MSPRTDAMPGPEAMSTRERVLSVLLLVVALLFLTCPVLAAPATSRRTAARDSATVVGSGGARRERGSLAASSRPSMPRLRPKGNGQAPGRGARPCRILDRKPYWSTTSLCVISRPPSAKRAKYTPPPTGRPEASRRSQRTA